MSVVVDVNEKLISWKFELHRSFRFLIGSIPKFGGFLSEKWRKHNPECLRPLKIKNMTPVTCFDYKLECTKRSRYSLVNYETLNFHQPWNRGSKDDHETNANCNLSSIQHCMAVRLNAYALTLDSLPMICFRGHFGSQGSDKRRAAGSVFIYERTCLDVVAFSFFFFFISYVLFFSIHR